MAAVVESKTSRVGKRPISLPKGVTATVQPGAVLVKGPKGELKRDVVSDVQLKVDGTNLLVSSTAPGRDAARLQGLYRALIAAMVKGTADGYTREL